MPNGEEFYLYPIELGYYTYPDLLNGSIYIEHVAEINDAIAYSIENRLRMQEARARRSGNG